MVDDEYRVVRFSCSVKTKEEGKFLLEISKIGCSVLITPGSVDHKVESVLQHRDESDHLHSLQVLPGTSRE